MGHISTSEGQAQGLTKKGGGRVRSRLVLVLFAMSVPLLLAARRSGADAGCGFSAPRGRRFTYGASAPIRLHDTRTETQSLRSVAVQTSITLRLDSSSRFYVFDQDLTDTSRDYGAYIGRACAPDRSVLLGAATAYCGPILSRDRPPPLCSYHPPNSPLITIADVRGYCFLNGTDVSPMRQCPGDNCFNRCDLHIPAECIGLTSNGSILNPYMVMPRYNRGLGVAWARLPYSQGIDGDDEVVQLTTPDGRPWGTQPRSVRNYDLGVCGAFITYQALADLVNEQFFKQYTTSIFSERDDDDVLQVLSAERLLSELKVGPVLQGNSVANNDLVSMWFRTDADIEVTQFTFGLAAYPTSDVFARLRVTTVSPQGMPGVWRLSIGGQIDPGLTWNRGGIRDRNISEKIASALRGTPTAPGLGAILSDTVSRLFLQPFAVAEEGSNARCERSGIGTAAGVSACEARVVPFDVLASGPEFGCHDEAEFSPATRVVLGRDVDRINSSTNEVRGVCATRLQARRVNVLPDELEIVLAEEEDSRSPPGLAGRQQMTQFLRFVISTSAGGVAPGIRIACDDKNGTGWNPAPQPGRIAQTGTMAIPAASVLRCDGLSACAVLRLATP